MWLVRFVAFRVALPLIIFLLSAYCWCIRKEVRSKLSFREFWKLMREQSEAARKES